MRHMKIRALFLLIAAVGLLSPAGLVSLAEEPTAPTSPPVFYKEVPAALQQEIAAIATRISEQSPLTAEEAQRAAELLASLDLRGSVVFDQSRPPVMAFFRCLGIRAVPLLAEELTAQDDERRLKAERALGFLCKPRERRDEAYEQTERALLVLSERSLLDRSPSLRRAALGTVGDTAWTARRDTAAWERAVRAIWSAVEDPEESIGSLATEYLIQLGEVPRPEGYDFIWD